MSNHNLVRQKFGRLLVLCDSMMRSSDGTIKWKCRCDCGNITHVSTTNLTSGNTQSCGCLQRERRIVSRKKENKYYESDDVIIANKSQNGANRDKTKGNTSGYKGVTTLRNGKYMAKITVNYKGIYLGCYNTPEEAYKAYKKAEEEYFGEYAYKGGEDRHE